jgi:hypothetical protein
LNTNELNLRPLLKLNRLVVYRAGKPVYDEPFHDGVNIIRGENGSGKSTITDFIFHVLGGEVGEWKEYAALCDSVAAEITVNDAVITIRRDVAKERQRPLHIFFGSFNDAMSHTAEGWQTFPYSRSATREAFSQIIFRSLNLPDAQSADGNSVTMHQMLRLLYVDQMTPVQRIFRFEQFDSPILKDAIGNFLCGVGGFDLFTRQTELREIERRFAAINTEIKSIAQVAGGLDTPLNRAGIQRQIDELNLERNVLFSDLDKLSRTDFGDKDTSKERESERRKAFEKIGQLRTEIQVLENEISTLAYEIEDSDKFITYLNQMLAAIDVSTLTYEELGGVRFEYCPACFTAVSAKTMAHHCHLCKEPLPDSERASRSLAVKLDMQIQRRESAQLQLERQATLQRYQAKLRGLRREHLSQTGSYDSLSRAPISSRDAHVAKLNQRVGFIDGTLRTLSERIELANKFDALSDEKGDLNRRISILKDEIGAIISAQDRRKREAYTRIADLTLNYLHRDTGVQDDFVKAQSVKFSFGDDIVQVDEKSNFAASSLVILKNSFHLAMVAASLSDGRFLLPRFMMFDNIEDKGMRPERSWNFQNLICNTSANAKTRHQIIFTTSMVDPALELTNLMVGPAYSKDHRTLRIA